MPQSLVRNGSHLVFGTEHREPFITPEAPAKLHAYLAGTLNALDCSALTVGGHVDHVHPSFYWQSGYGAFSVSPSNEAQVTASIARQEEYHKTTTFPDEFRELRGGSVTRRRPTAGNSSPAAGSS